MQCSEAVLCVADINKSSIGQLKLLSTNQVEVSTKMSAKHAVLDSLQNMAIPKIVILSIV